MWVVLVFTAVVLKVWPLEQHGAGLLKMQMSGSHRRPTGAEILGWCPAVRVNVMLKCDSSWGSSHRATEGQGDRHRGASGVFLILARSFLPCSSSTAPPPSTVTHKRDPTAPRSLTPRSLQPRLQFLRPQQHSFFNKLPPFPHLHPHSKTLTILSRCTARAQESLRNHIMQSVYLPRSRNKKYNPDCRFLCSPAGLPSPNPSLLNSAGHRLLDGETLPRPLIVPLSSS